MSVIEDAATMLKARLSELDAERVKLENAIKGLVGGGGVPAKRRGRPPGRPRKAAASGAGKARRKRRGGTRADQTVQFIAENPGTSASDVARALKIKPNYLYRVLGDLEKQGRVKKDGRSYSASA